MRRMKNAECRMKKQSEDILHATGIILAFFMLCEEIFVKRKANKWNG